MIRFCAVTLGLALVASAAGVQASRSDDNATTWTGWFSDKSCAASRVARGEIRPNGTACVKECLNTGVTPVFISEQAKTLFEVKDHPSVLDDVGYHVEVTGIVNEAAGTFSVRSVKRLSLVGALCALPKKPGR